MYNAQRTVWTLGNEVRHLKWAGPVNNLAWARRWIVPSCDNDRLLAWLTAFIEQFNLFYSLISDLCSITRAIFSLVFVACIILNMKVMDIGNILYGDDPLSLGYREWRVQVDRFAAVSWHRGHRSECPRGFDLGRFGIYFVCVREWVGAGHTQRHFKYAHWLASTLTNTTATYLLSIDCLLDWLNRCWLFSFDTQKQGPYMCRKLAFFLDPCHPVALTSTLEQDLARLFAIFNEG